MCRRVIVTARSSTASKVYTQYLAYKHSIFIILYLFQQFKGKTCNVNEHITLLNFTFLDVTNALPWLHCNKFYLSFHYIIVAFLSFVWYIYWVLFLLIQNLVVLVILFFVGVSSSKSLFGYTIKWYSVIYMWLFS